MGHQLFWGSGRFWLVNTLFNALETIDGDWCFVPQWPGFAHRRHCR
jgi:hypothetical protein